MNDSKFWKAVAAVALVIAFIGVFTPAGQSVVGAIGTRFPNGVAVGSSASIATAGELVTSGIARFLGTTKIGSSGTSLTQVNAGTCYIWPYATTIAASSTATVDCQATALIGAAAGGTALTGVTAGDSVVASLATSTAGTTFLGLSVIGQGASSTQGFITLRLANLTGTTYTWPTTGTASGTAYYISDR